MACRLSGAILRTNTRCNVEGIDSEPGGAMTRTTLAERPCLAQFEEYPSRLATSRQNPDHEIGPDKLALKFRCPIAPGGQFLRNERLYVMRQQRVA